jgi:hypothetical protein
MKFEIYVQDNLSEEQIGKLIEQQLHTVISNRRRRIIDVMMREYKGYK